MNKEKLKNILKEAKEYLNGNATGKTIAELIEAILDESCFHDLDEFCSHDWQIATNGYTCRKCGVWRREEKECECVKYHQKVDWGKNNCPCKCHQPPECKHEYLKGDICQDCFERHPELLPKPPENWEVELKEKWLNSSGITSVDFIIREIKSQKSQLIKEIEERRMTTDITDQFRSGYNKACDDIIKIIKK